MRAKMPRKLTPQRKSATPSPLYKKAIIQSGIRCERRSAMPPPIITAITAQDEALKKCQNGSRSSSRARIRPVCLRTRREKTKK